MTAISYYMKHTNTQNFRNMSHTLRNILRNTHVT